MPDALLQLVNRAGGWPRIGLALVGLGAFGLVLAFARWTTAPEWVVVASGVDQVSEVAPTLEEAGFEVEYDRGGGSLSVMAKDLAKARVALAQAGFNAEPSGFQLFDEGNWGITDFAEKVNYRRALEAELSRTISNLDGIEHTRVHLAMEPRSFITTRDSENEASVVLFLRPGYEPRPDAVSGIAGLVSGSVERLLPENVTVVDNSGRILSSENSFGIGLSDQQLAARQELEAYLEHKAQELLSPHVGSGNSRVTVSAEMDFDQINRSSTSVDPDLQVAIQEERSEIIPRTDEQGAGQVQSSTVYETSTTEEVLVRHGARLERLSAAVLVNDKEIADGDSIRTEPRTAEELAQLEALVRNAIGITPGRGDEITIVGLAFEPPPQPIPEGFDVLGLLEMLLKPLVGVLGLILAYVLATRTMKTLKEMAPAALLQSPRAPAGAVPAGAGGSAGLSAGSGGGGLGAGGLGDVPAGPQQTHRGGSDRRVELSDPSMTARVVRAWLNE